MGAIGDLVGLVLFGADIRPNQKSKSSIWKIFMRIVYYSVLLLAIIFLFAPTILDTLES